MLNDCFAVSQLPSMSSYFMLSYRLCIYLLLSPEWRAGSSCLFPGSSQSIRQAARNIHPLCDKRGHLLCLETVETRPPSLYLIPSTPPSNLLSVFP